VRKARSEPGDAQQVHNCAHELVVSTVFGRQAPLEASLCKAVCGEALQRVVEQMH
jgi:hypothetical protein